MKSAKAGGHSKTGKDREIDYIWKKKAKLLPFHNKYGIVNEVMDPKEKL